MAGGEQFGAFLVQKQILPREKIEDALQNQSILGGKLGTNLVELGYLTLEQLEDCLSQFYQVPAVGPTELDQVNAGFLQTVPKRLFDKYVFLPLRKSQDSLIIATAEPQDQKMLMELSSVLAMKVFPKIASEIRMLFYLEHLLGRKSDMRFRSIFFHYRKTRALGRQEFYKNSAVNQSQLALIKKGFKPLAVGEELTQEGFEEFLLENSMNLQARAAGRVPPASPRPQASPRTATPAPAAPTTSSQMTLEDLDKMLTTLSDRQVIAERAFDFALQFLDAAFLFVVNSGLVVGFQARGRGHSRETVRDLVVPLAGSSVFKTVADSQGHFFGRVSPEPLNETLFAALGIGPQQEILVIPVMMKKRLVNIFLGDPGKKPLTQPNMKNLLNLTKWLPKAYEQIIMRNKQTLNKSL